MLENGPAYFLRQHELCQFLKFARSRITPADAGLVSVSRRRVRGLRRDELAALCNVSVAWYTWFETGRPGTRVSPRFVRAVAEALRLSDAETLYLFSLAIPEMPKSACPLRPQIGATLSSLAASFSSVSLSDAARSFSACDALPIGVYCTMPDGTIVYANESLYRLLGYKSKSSYLRLNVSRDIYLRPDERIAWQREIERTGSVRDALCDVRRSDGSVFRVRDSAYAVTPIDTPTLCYVGTWEGHG
jgi:PAS domain-containing protein